MSSMNKLVYFKIIIIILIKLNIIIITIISAGPSYSSSALISLPHLLISQIITLLSEEADAKIATF